MIIYKILLNILVIVLLFFNNRLNVSNKGKDLLFFQIGVAIKMFNILKQKR